MHNPYHVMMALNAIGYGDVWCFVQWRAMRFNESDTMLCHVMMCCAVQCSAKRATLFHTMPWCVNCKRTVCLDEWNEKMKHVTRTGFDSLYPAGLVLLSR